MEKILFVCVENSCRSQIAEAFAKHYRSSGVEIFSAGSKPSGKVNPKAVTLMAEQGHDLSRQQSSSLHDTHGHRYQVVVTMGCGDSCAEVAADYHEDWPVPDPKKLNDKEFRVVCQEIERRVVELLRRLNLLAQ